jgi:hypothetical protein
MRHIKGKKRQKILIIHLRIDNFNRVGFEHTISVI